VICRRNEPIAELRALPKRRSSPRAIFEVDPRFRLSDSFFEPLPEALLEAFEGPES
jgi:hypothetical protein